MPKVLLIDDDESYRAYVTTLLHRHGYEVHDLRNGRALSAIIAAESFDAIITDVYMPEVDGIEILRQAKRLAPDLAVIGMTGGGVSGHASDGCNRAMAMLGAVAVLPKPFDEPALLDLLRRAIEERHSCLTF